MTAATTDTWRLIGADLETGVFVPRAELLLRVPAHEALTAQPRVSWRARYLDGDAPANERDELLASTASVVLNDPDQMLVRYFVRAPAARQQQSPIGELRVYDAGDAEPRCVLDATIRPGRGFCALTLVESGGGGGR